MKEIYEKYLGELVKPSKKKGNKIISKSIHEYIKNDQEKKHVFKNYKIINIKWKNNDLSFDVQSYNNKFDPFLKKATYSYEFEERIIDKHFK